MSDNERNTGKFNRRSVLKTTAGLTALAGLPTASGQLLGNGDNQSPTAAFTADKSNPKVGQKVTFDASSSQDPDGSIDNYAWSFGDGETGSGETVSHTYKTQGWKFVKLTVTDNDGAQANEWGFITVRSENEAPTASWTSDKSKVEIGKPVKFDASASKDPDGTIKSYKWNFGDGSTGTGEKVSHKYETSGLKMVVLTVTDDKGARGRKMGWITVKRKTKRPNASFTVSKKKAKVGESIKFDASKSNDPDGTIKSYKWNFGDGSTAKGTVVNHAYDSPGTNIATLTVTDNEGATDREYETVRIKKDKGGGDGDDGGDIDGGFDAWISS